ncbi:MAG: putative bifunctional diguanylate cyclase/phosphodiesterase [Pyrinomonadaceae bacterium]
MQNNLSKQRLTEPYMRLIVAAGAAVCLFSAFYLPVASLDSRFLLFAFITITIGSRIGIQIPRVKAEITVSDTFIFLTLLLYGGEAAILVAAAEAFCSSLRFSKKWMTRFFNASLLACSTFITVWTLRACFGSVERLTEGDYTAYFIIAICVMAFVQYVANSGLAALRESFKLDKPFFQTWKTYYLWTSLTYFAGASAAGVNAKLIHIVGFYAFLVTIPIIAIVYFTYRTYRANLESAENHVEELSRHIAEQERISNALQESEESLRSAFDHAAGMALVAPEGRWLKVNRSLSEILGYTEQEFLCGNFQDLIHEEDLGTLLIHINKLLQGKVSRYQVEQRHKHKLGHLIWVMLSVSLVRDGEGKPLHFIFQIQDITDRKRAEEQLVHDAFHDALTGLPNRALLIDHLKLAIERVKHNPERQFAVLFLDFDRFKVINDSLGHMIGDQLLIGVARRLEECMRPLDTIARLGGDEFTILLEDIRDIGDAIRTVERIHQKLSRPFNLGGHEVFTTVSIGIAPSTTGYNSPQELLRDADTAMYRAKSLGKARHEIFDTGMHASAMNLMQVETDLRQAIERDELFLTYQPIVSLENGKLNGFEALVRWRHPTRGLVSPLDFIPVAEETGLIIRIGRWVLREACRQMRQWQIELSSSAPSYISVNLSNKQFAHSDLFEQIISTLQDIGLDPRALKLEITESAVMENVEGAIETLQRLKALGIELSIDDFGTGYSSLSNLHRLPVDTLKVDRSFVSRMSENDENMEIVRTILMLARNLKMKVVAEGVETKEQMEQLRNLKCQSGQGYFFSKPVEAEAAASLSLAASSQWQTPILALKESSQPEAVELLEAAYSM